MRFACFPAFYVNLIYPHDRLLSAAVNSLYSFWWDVTNDWGLEMFTQEERRPMPPRSLLLPTRLHSDSPLLGRRPLSLSTLSALGESRHPWGLRSTTRYPLVVYPLAIFLNLVLRMTWSIKLSSHLHNKTDGSMVIFCFEVAEIFRRWMWVFIRVEWEGIKREKVTQGGNTLSRPVIGSNSEEPSDDGDYELVDESGHDRTPAALDP